MKERIEKRKQKQREVAEKIKLLKKRKRYVVAFGKTQQWVQRDKKSLKRTIKKCLKQLLKTNVTTF